MGKLKNIQFSFASGELTPSVHGRKDREIYGNGLERARNVYITPLGGSRRRPGTKYIDTTTSGAAPRFIPFQFNVDQKYLIVFTAGQFKVYKDGALQATVSSSPISSLTATQIRQMKFTQSLDTLILVHPDIQPIRILRVSDTTWTPSSITLSNIPTFDFGSGAEAVWSSTKGWPRSAAFWNQRLWFGGSKSRPATIWASKIAGFFDFNLGTGADADAIEITIDDDQVNAIENIFGGRTLQVFSQGGEYFSPVTLDRTITPATIKLERATRHGSGAVGVLSSDGATVYVERSGRVVREYVFLDVEQSYISEDISFLAEHLIRNPVASALQKSQEKLAGEYSFFVNTDGTIAVLNRRRSQNFIAWTLWETDGQYTDIAVVGNDLYASVKRTIGGTPTHYIEMFDWAYFVDSGKVLSQSPAGTAWSGLSHLNGEEVVVRTAGGYPLLRQTVDTGAIETERAELSIQAGLPINVQLKTLPPASDDAVGIMGERTRIVSINMQLKDCGSFDISTGGSPVRVSLKKVGDYVLGQAPPLFTGWWRSPLTGYSRAPFVDIVQEEPIEFEILSCVMEVTS
jgi:hypothetical protein